MTWDDAIELLRDPSSCLKIIFVLIIIHGIIYQVCVTKLKKWVLQKPWWPDAIPLQRALLVNFGYPEAECDDAACLMGFSFVLVFCGHHLLAGAAMLPVTIYGWTEAGAAWQFGFIFAAICDVAITCFDEWEMIMRLLFPKQFAWLGPKMAVPFFVIVGLLHHPLSICMSTPMVWYYASAPAYHQICVALLFAAGICFTTGSYKFTLNTKTKSGFIQYKLIVLVQLVTIYFSRGYIWPTRAYTLLATFYNDGAKGFFWGGCIAATLMTLFNLVMILDATQAAAKWLPKAMPKSDDDHAELQDAIVKGTAAAMGRPQTLTMKAGAKKMHMTATTLVAAAKFKKALGKKKDASEPLLQS